MKVEVIRAAPEQQPILAHLLELYAHDFSEIADLEIGADGRFGYEQLPLYWQEPQRHPFLIKVNGKLAGFVFVHQGSLISGEKEIWDVAEFFVVRGYRRHGIGMKAAQQVWKMFSGQWEVRVMERNVAAKEFWERAVSEFTGETARAVTVEKDGKRWHVFSFLVTGQNRLR
jgi:predicted acetyltransferase